MAVCLSRLNAYSQAVPRHSTFWRHSVQPNFWRYAQSHGERAFHQSVYTFAKRRPSTTIVKPHAIKTQPATPRRKPLPGLEASQQSTAAATGSESNPIIDRETSLQPTEKSRLPTVMKEPVSDSVVDEPKAGYGYRSPSSEILEALNRNQNIPVTDRNAGILAAELASKSEPMVLFQSSKQTQFALISYTSSTFLFWAGYMNTNTYAAASSLWLYAAGYMPLAIFVLFAVYLGAAPQKMIKSITAIPPLRTSKLSRQPLLKVEFVQIFPGIKFSPVELPVASVLRMHRISDKVDSLEAAREQETRRSNFGNGFFNRVRLVLQDSKKMFDRKHYMGYVRIRGSKGLVNGTWKMDLSDAQLAHQGKVLDILLAKDWNPPNWRRSLSYTDERSS